MTDARLSRRTLLHAGGAIGIATVLGSMTGGTASAAPATTVTDLGPALVQFSLMSSVVVGDVVYIGSRNILPARVVAFHLPTRTVIGRTDLSTGHSIQAMVADPAGRYLYLGVLQKGGGPQPNLHRWDLSTLERPAEPIGRIADRDVRDMAVAPDGVVFAVGGSSPTAPALWQYDPGTGQVTSLGVPDPSATARAGGGRDRVHRVLRRRQHPRRRRDRGSRVAVRPRPRRGWVHEHHAGRDAGRLEHA